MPILNSTYNPKWWAKSMNLSTIWASQFRSSPKLELTRKRLELDDGDFLDLDLCLNNKKQLVLLLHGLEGNSKSRYMVNMADYFIQNGFDAILLNHRSCSEEDNRLFSCYHSGKSDDLNRVLIHLNTNYSYDSIVLVGFSLGGNMSLKYLGETWNKPSNIKCCVAISPPIDLGATGRALNRTKNWVYAQTFLKTMRKKLALKLAKFPENDKGQLGRVKNLHDFDNEYTGPAHGFGNAQGYYDTCSSKYFIKNITIPTYILTAKNDSFMEDPCFPYDLVKSMNHVYLETPKWGGHVGFVQSGRRYYQEKRALEFVEAVFKGNPFH